MGDTVADDQIYRLTYDGQVADEHGFAVMGGNTEAVTGHLRENYRPGSSLGEVLQLAVGALGQSDAGSRVIAAADLEVAVLDRTRSQQRKFKRLSAEHLASLLGERVGEEAGRHAAGDSTNPSNTDQTRNRDQEQPPVAPPVAPPVSPQPQQPPQPSDPVTPPEHPDVYPPVDPGDPLR